MTSANNAPQRGAPPQQAPARPRPRGPVTILVATIVGFVASIITSLVIGTLVEIAGHYTLWQGQGVAHARAEVHEDLEYIQQFPRSILVPNTVQFAKDVVRKVAWPWERLNAQAFFDRMRQVETTLASETSMKRIVLRMMVEIAHLLEILLYVAQDTAVRLAIAFFALPAFAMACLFGLLDGLVRRDQRKFSGGRESSFVYHHSKQYTAWFLTGGFALYLAWPFGGFNPAYMVLVFATLVAASLSVTGASFKKYL
jgi:integrating conjugative element membrane protein (TIGR03747 family)